MSVPDELKIQLEMRDRLNYPVILQHSLTQLESAYSAKDFDLGIVQNLIYGLYKKIPSSWKDEAFNKALKNVFYEIEIDNRPSFGSVKVSLALCEKLEIPVVKKVNGIHYFDLLNAIVDLLDRKNMLVSRRKMEMSTGRNLDEGDTPLDEFHKMTLEEIENLEDEESLDDIADKDIEESLKDDGTD